MAPLRTVILFGCALVATTSASPTSPHSSHSTSDYCPKPLGAPGVKLRLPPSMNNGKTPVYWKPPPVGWYSRLWHMIYASNPQYTAFRNFQYDSLPLNPADPAGPVNDLSSFQLPGNSTIYTSYGVDTPHPTLPAVLEYEGTGILAGATSEYSGLTWGCDKNGVPYYASYSTATEQTSTPAGIDILSASDLGPDQKTVDAIINGLKKLPNQEIKDLAATMTKMVQDGSRRGLPRVVCDDYCKSNQDLLAILG